MQIFPATSLLDISSNHVDHRSNRENSWYGFVDGENWGAIPFYVSNLYRGQNTRYIPLLPSIARGLQTADISEIWQIPISDQAKIVLRLAQSWWFSRELKHHPISTHAIQQKLDLDPIALAQHYGIPTGYLDLTDDFNVSAFFATCRETDGWEPIGTGVGVIYKVNLTKLKSPFVGYYTPLGPQQLPRPTEQCAWVVELPLTHSFEGWPDISMLQFQHDRNVGEYFLNMFAGGKQLFPPDPLTDVASEILTCREIPSELIDAALDSFANDPLGIKAEHLTVLRREISNLATMINYRQLLTEERLSALLSDSDWRKKCLKMFR